MDLDLELAAWRFLSLRRCPGLSVAHLEFIDGPEPTLTTPADELGFYESATGATFGEAAIALARELGAPWDTDCDEEQTASGLEKSSADTADNGENESSSLPTRLAPAGSITDVTGVEHSDAMRGAP